MSTYMPVNVYVVDNTTMENPVSGVVVRVFSQDGLTVITEALTDDTGLAAFMLASEFTYQVRFFKFQVGFQNPQYIEVQDPPVQNGFQTVATILTPPLSQDARLCIAYGYFRTVTGAPAPNTDIQFISKFDPLIMDGSGITNERQIARTDENGYVQVPLIKLGHYSVIVAGMEDIRRDIRVPDLPNINIADLIWPVVSAITFDPPGPYLLVIGVDQVVSFKIATTDGNTDWNHWDVIWSTDKEYNAVVLPSGNKLTLRGLSVGTANLIARPRDCSIIAIPRQQITNIPQLLTVVEP